MCRVLLHYVGVVQAPRTYTNHTSLTSTELARCEGCLSTRAGWFKHSEPPRTYTNHTITELARCVGCCCTSSGGSSTSNLHEPHHHCSSKVCRVLLHEFRVVQAPRTDTNHTITALARCVGCFCTSSGWFKHSEPTRTTPSQCSRCVGHSFGVVEAHRTSSNLQETHHHRASTVCRVLLHSFGVVQAQRTYTNHTIPESTVCRELLHESGVVQAQRTSSNLTKLTSTELARCVGCFCTSSGWLKHSEPQRTYTLLTITELARCVGCFCTRAGWFKHVEPHRTYTNHTSTERARCVGCLSTSSGGSSTENLHEPHHHRASKVCRVLLH